MCNARRMRDLSPGFCASSLQHETWICDYEGWVFYCDCCYLLGQLYFINSYNYQIHNTITWNVVFKPLIFIQLRIELHSDSFYGILTMLQHAAAVNVNWWYECFIDIVIWMFINIWILYIHFVNHTFSTYCVVRVWYDLCAKKEKKEKKRKIEKSGGTRSAVGDCEEAGKSLDWWLINSSPLGQNGSHVAADIFIYNVTN